MSLTSESCANCFREISSKRPDYNDKCAKCKSKYHLCPICNVNPMFTCGYCPRDICGSCVNKAVDKNKDKVEFSNTSIWGSGFQATIYKKDGSKFISDDRHNFFCYIDGIECIAEEHRFGGISVQPR